MDEILKQIGSFVVREISDEVVDIEENCGSMWITTKSGKVFSVSVMETESEDEA